MNTNILRTREQDSLVVIEFALGVDDARLFVDLLDLVAPQQSFLDLLEVPSYEEWPSRSHDTGVLPGSSIVVVEPGWGEADRRNLEFGDVLDMDLELFRGWLLLSHPLLESELAT